MWPYRVSNLGPLALKSDALPTALRGPVKKLIMLNKVCPRLYGHGIIYLAWIFSYESLKINSVKLTGNTRAKLRMSYIKQKY